MTATLPDISRLTLEQKISLLERLKDSIAAEPQPVYPVPEWLKEELRRRHEEYLRDPGQAVTWEEAKAWILDRNARTQSSNVG